MPKYHLVNSRTERLNKRNNKKEISNLSNIIYKKNESIIELRKRNEVADSANNYLDSTYKFLYSTYCRLYNDFEELSSHYNKVKWENETLNKKYKELLDEFVETEIQNEN